MTVYIEHNIDSKELFDILVGDNIPCFIIKLPEASTWCSLITLENIKKYKYRFKYKNKTRRSCFIPYKLHDPENARYKITKSIYIGNKLCITWKIGSLEGCIMVETYKVSEEIIEAALTRL